MITKEEFMKFFRADDFYSKMTVEECKEIFATVMKGKSDFVPQQLNEIFGDYDTGLTVAKLNSADMPIVDFYPKQWDEVPAKYRLMGQGDECFMIVRNDNFGRALVLQNYPHEIRKLAVFYEHESAVEYCLMLVAEGKNEG